MALITIKGHQCIRMVVVFENINDKILTLSDGLMLVINNFTVWKVTVPSLEMVRLAAKMQYDNGERERERERERVE